MAVFLLALRHGLDAFFDLITGGFGFMGSSVGGFFIFGVFWALCVVLFEYRNTSKSSSFT